MIDDPSDVIRGWFIIDTLMHSKAYGSEENGSMSCTDVIDISEKRTEAFFNWMEKNGIAIGKEGDF
jgi:hypothetical protein